MVPNLVRVPGPINRSVPTLLTPEDEAELVRGRTQVFRFELPLDAEYGADEPTTRVELRKRAPLSEYELTPGHFCWGAGDAVSLELEARAILAARYSDAGAARDLAFQRHDDADIVLLRGRSVYDKIMLLQQWDEANARILGGVS